MLNKSDLLKLNNTQVFGLLLGLGLILRFFSFFPSVINHDESTYLVIANALLRGEIYFVDAVDTKPIGIFIVFALFQQIFGSSIVLLRLAVAIWLVTTAYLLYKTKLKIDQSFNGAIASGIIYLLLNSIFTFYGVSPNTELFFNLFTILAIYLIIDQGEARTWVYLVAGLCLGAGFVIKYVVLFDAFAIALFVLWERRHDRGKLYKSLRHVIIMAVGALFFQFRYI